MVGIVIDNPEFRYSSLSGMSSQRLDHDDDDDYDMINID